MKFKFEKSIKMIRFIKLLSIFTLLVISVKAQNEDILKKQIEFLEQIKGSFEGYQSSDCKNTLSYHSLRNDISEGLLTRATNGSMEIEWQTQSIPDYFKAEGAHFVWLAGLDLTEKKINFDEKEIFMLKQHSNLRNTVNYQ